MDAFRDSILQRGPIESFALKTVQDFIQPQRQTKLAQDENQMLENMLRTLLQQLVASAAQSGEQIMQYGQLIDDVNINGQIPRLLDVVLYLCEKEHVEGGMIFQLLEDLTEMSTMKNCKDVFGYIESKQDILGKQELFARGKLVMLRTCNQLLRRLSKANDVVFCGRILMFLAHFFPLSERSAVNIKGVFNTSNETKYEKDPPKGISVDFNFYKTFWSLQEYFCNPASLTTASTKWQKFSSSLAVVLNTFDAQPLSEEEGEANSLEEEAATFNIKYLTSSKLMGLELKDSSFRRHILLQCLILFDYLRAPGKNDKDLPSETMKEELKSCEDRVKKLLEITPPKGKEFLRAVEHILEREKNWVWWKRDGCPPFEKQPIEKKSPIAGQKRRRPRWRLGNKELSQLWRWAELNPDAVTDSQRVKTPDVADYWKPLAEDMDPSAGIEDAYHHKNNRVYCWKGLRFAARQDLEGFSRFTDLGIEGVVPLELLPPEVRSKYQAKPNEKAKRAKKDETKGGSLEEETKGGSLVSAEGTLAGGSTSEAEGEVGRGESEAMESDAVADTPTPEEQQRLGGSDTDNGQEAGQIEDAETEEGGLMETDLNHPPVPIS
ncbi:THO complex subunit 1 [Raphanus sativus]|uniref:THO complex subunit 1 isoform X1 n=1 Tax=Raphanus sativus TaxID=3726 RepID=A0A6J0MGE0_RAPSA|nr:THO complex subunit 1 isoform X1 [Raphanus sativus]KAJ4911824.1 THO complex subunit 1 [Raphanus sativus]